MEDVIVKEDFFEHNLIDDFWIELKSHNKSIPFVAKNGPFAGKLMADQDKIHAYDNLPVTQTIIAKIKEFFNEPIIIREVNYVILHRPWDIHSDEDLPTNEGYSYFNILIPLQDVDSSTIIFNQVSTGNRNFSDYKSKNEKVKDPISQKFWDERLSFCWPQDREYLTLHTVCPFQRKGQLVAFNRSLFHSSDSWYKNKDEPKYFVQILIDKPF